ncbi:hypothetical protein A2U01_0055482, partial [Trifolium medium]|nr:hypothetical protein [Trifolium medium]
GIELLRVGVEGRDNDRVDGADGECFSTAELVETERILEGVEDLDAVGREVGVEGLAEDVERVTGEDGLM